MEAPLFGLHAGRTGRAGVGWGGIGGSVWGLRSRGWSLGVVSGGVQGYRENLPDRMQLHRVVRAGVPVVRPCEVSGRAVAVADESSADVDDPDPEGVGYRVVDVTGDPPWVAARQGVDYVRGARCARRSVERFVSVAESVTGGEVLCARPAISTDGEASGQVEMTQAMMDQLSDLLGQVSAGLAGSGGPVVADAESGESSGAPLSGG